MMLNKIDVLLQNKEYAKHRTVGEDQGGAGTGAEGAGQPRYRKKTCYRTRPR